MASILAKNLFNGKVAIVTGGGTGIGKAITEELLYLGANVVIASRNIDRLRKAEAEINSSLQLVPVSGKVPRILALQCNIRRENEVKGLVDQTLAVYGRLDYLVNNGGGQFPGALADFSLKGWNAVIETNLTGTFLLCKEVYNSYMQHNGGSIVNIIVDMFRGFPMMSHSGAARAGVDNLTKSLAVEWASSGIRINSVAPGIIYSETAAANYSDPNIMDSAIPRTVTGRLGTPAEISSLVCFLLSPGASYITGETIKVDGGLHLYGKISWDVPVDHNKLPAFDPKTIKDDVSKPKSKL